MVRYHPRHLSIALHLLIVVINLVVGSYLARVALNEEGGMRLFLWGAACNLVLVAYLHAAPLFSWPCAVSVDRKDGEITFCYLLFRRTVPVDRIERCVVCEAMNRYPYATYILVMKNGAQIVLSALTIAHFPGPFAYNIGLDVTERRPRFFPGFRWLSHKK